MATSTPGDNVALGPNVGKAQSMAPIIVQNNISPYSMANGGKPRGGLGGIQNSQPTATVYS